MNSEKIKELFLAIPFLLGHTNPAALRNGGQFAVWPAILLWVKLHLPFNKATGQISFQYEK